MIRQQKSASEYLKPNSESSAKCADSFAECKTRRDKPNQCSRSAWTIGVVVVLIFIALSGWLQPRNTAKLEGESLNSGTSHRKLEDLHSSLQTILDRFEVDYLGNSCRTILWTIINFTS